MKQLRIEDRVRFGVRIVITLENEVLMGNYVNYIYGTIDVPINN